MNKVVIAVFFLFFLAVCLIGPELEPYREYVSAYEEPELLVLEGTPFEAGQQYGEHSRDAIIRNLDLFWSEAESQGFSREEVLAEGKDFEALMLDICACTIEEIAGIAQSARVCYDELLAFNALHVTVFRDGCTNLLAAGSATVDGKAYLHKNRDLSSAPEQVIIERSPSDGYSFIGISSAGATNVAMGINEKGVSTGTTTLYTWDTGSGLAGHAMNSKILAEASTAQEALSVIANTARRGGTGYGIADANEVALVETTHTAYGVKWVVDDAIASTNHYILPEMEQYEDRSSFASTTQRLNRGNELLQKNLGQIDAGTLIDIGSDTFGTYSINSSRTLAASTFDGSNVIMYGQLGRPNYTPVIIYKDLAEYGSYDVQVAIEAIEDIPQVITLEDMMSLRIARHYVDVALSFGAAEADIENLDLLVKAEEDIDSLYKNNFMRQSYADLHIPHPDNSTAQRFFTTRHDYWWEGGHYVNGMDWLPLGSLSISYSGVGDTYPEGRWLEYDLDHRDYSFVKFYAGIADESELKDYPLTFAVYGDGALLEEKVLEYGEYAEYFLVDIEGVESIRFHYYAHDGLDDDDAANQLVFVEPQFLTDITPEIEDAVGAAEAAIAALPDNISLLDAAAVEAARAAVDEAIESGVEVERPRPEQVEGSVYKDRIANLSELVEAEEALKALYHYYYEQQSLHVLGDPGTDHCNSNWLVDFENPDRWSVHTQIWEDRGFVNFQGFAPLKVFTSGLSRIGTEPLFAEWDISGLEYNYLEGYFGLSDSCGGGARFPLDFRIYGDGLLLFESHIRYGADAAFYRVNVEDVSWVRFEYSAEMVSSGNFAGWPVFAEPLFLYAPKTELAVSEAESLIASLPAEISDEDKEAVQAARAAANNALALGADESDLDNYSLLLNAEKILFHVTYGDINGDGKVGIDDAVEIFRFVLGKTSFDQRQLVAADLDGNGQVNVGDVVILLRHLVGLVDVFPVEM